MPKSCTFPTLFDEVKTISISFLKKHGYLVENRWQRGQITWSRNGVITSRISINVNTIIGNPYIALDYRCNDMPISYQVQLVSVPSNLGKGVVWYFICPKTGKRCRILYMTDTYFYHRLANKGGMYGKQTLSKKYRILVNELEIDFKVEKSYEQLYRKHFKKFYAGKKTRLYMRLLKQISGNNSC